MIYYNEVHFTNVANNFLGWGTVFYGGSSSSVLMEVDVPVWTQKDCISSFTQEITLNQLCAGAYDGNGDACQVSP